MINRLSLPLMIALTVPVFSAGCRSREAKVAATRKATAQEEAALLGAEIFDLMDRAVSYRSSHRGRAPRRLRQVGVDSLTPTTARWLRRAGRTPLITVEFRHPRGHQVAGCTGTDQILEQVSLEGTFRVECALTDGSRRPFTIALPAGATE